jgi:hypothetical protein
VSELLQFQAAVELTAAAGGPPRVSILAYSGGLATAAGFGPFVLSLDGLSLPSSIPLLANHENTLNAICGQGMPSVRSGQLYVEGHLTDASEGGKLVLGLHRSGIRLQASIGAVPSDVLSVREGEVVTANGKTHKAPRGGFRYVRAAELKEVSIVAISGDSNSAVSIAASKGKSIMENEPLVDPQAIRQQERERLREIDRICSNLRLDGNAARQLQAARQKAIDGEIEPDALRATALDLIRSSRPDCPIIVRPSAPSGSVDVLAASILCRSGHEALAVSTYGERIAEQSRQLQSMSLVELSAHALRASGHDVPRDRHEMIRASTVSTGSMAVALSEAGRRVLVSQYQAAPAPWRTFASKRSVEDFRLHKGVRPSFFGDLSEVAPGGEIEHASFGEEVYEFQASTFAKQLGISRRDFINDDLGVFSEVLPSMARAAARTLNDLVATCILDGIAANFWASDRGNISSTESQLDAAGLESALKLLREMKDAEGSYLDLMPAAILATPAWEARARQLLNSTEVARDGSADNQGIANPFAGLATLVIDPRLADANFHASADPNHWWLFSAPSNASVIVAFLDGRDAPILESFSFDQDVNRLAMSWRVYHDFGCALADYRASIYSDGSTQG